MKLALEADRVFTGRSDGTEKAVVVLDDDRIVAVETWLADDAIPILHLPGTTLLPGLIDAHTHVSVLPACGNQIDQMKRPADEQLAAGRANLLADLTSGVTTMRIMGQELDVDFRLRDEIADGRTLGPDLICAGVQLAKPGGHGHALTSVSTVDDIVRLVDANASRGAGLIKIFTTGGVSSVASSQGDCPFTDREIRAAADAAHRHGLKLASHAHGGTGAKLAIENGVDTIEHGALLDERLIDAAARRGLAVVGTFSIAEHPLGVEAGDAKRPEIIAKLREVRTRVGDTWRRILQSGVDIALGYRQHARLSGLRRHAVDRIRRDAGARHSRGHQRRRDRLRVDRSRHDCPGAARRSHRRVGQPARRHPLARLSGPGHQGRPNRSPSRRVKADTVSRCTPGGHHVLVGGRVAPVLRLPGAGRGLYVGDAVEAEKAPAVTIRQAGDRSCGAAASRAHPCNRLRFDLPHALARDREAPADLLERVLRSVPSP